MSLLMTLSMATTLPVYASTTDHLLINQVYGTGGKQNVLLAITL